MVTRTKPEPEHIRYGKNPYKCEHWSIYIDFLNTNTFLNIFVIRVWK